MQWQPSIGTIGAPAKLEPLPADPTRPLVSYRKQWLWVCLFASLAAYFYDVSTKTPAAPHPVTPVASLGDWFFILRLPEAPVDKTAQALYRQRVESWLEALKVAQFQPLFLSDALQRLAKGDLLPTRSVVVVFDPGMRRTYEVIDPVLQSHHWPATWLTSHDVLASPDTTYVSRHVARQMKKTGRWEMAYYDSARHAFSIDPDSEGVPEPWRPALLWSPLIRGLALNRTRQGGPLNSLDISLSMTGARLVDMLLAELPLKHQAVLTLHASGSRLLGRVIELPAESLPPAFDFETLPEERHRSVLWPGTRACRNAEIQFNVLSWAGDLWLQLRQSASSKGGVRVGFKENTVMVQYTDEQGMEQFFRWNVPDLERGPLQAKIFLINEQLKLSVNGESFPEIQLPPVPNWQEGTLELHVQDRVRGIAQASDVDLRVKML